MKSKKRKKAIPLILITIIIIGITHNKLYINSNAVARNQVNVAVLESNPNDSYIALIRQGLENIEKSNKDKIKFTFYDTKLNHATESEILDSVLKNNYDLILGNLVDTTGSSIESFIDKIKQKNIPGILFNSAPLTITNKMKSYEKFIIITTDPKEAGTLQGKLIADEWNKNKSLIDKNNDNIMQYIMLQGALNNTGAIERTVSSISTIERSGIKIEQLSKKVLLWNQQLAKDAVESLFLNYGNKIEGIISNNDAMAIGAVEALQKYGYNKGDPSKYIAIFGIDGIQAAQELIKKGFMTGTVYEEPTDTSEALYKVGLNLYYGLPPLEGTTYKFDDTGFIIRIPYREVITQ